MPLQFWAAWGVLQGKCSVEMGGRLVLRVGMGVISSLEVSEGQSSRADLGNVVWSDSSCLTCTSLALCPSDSAHLSHRKHSPVKRLPLIWIFHHLMELESTVSLLGVVATFLLPWLVPGEDILNWSLGPESQDTAQMMWEQSSMASSSHWLQDALHEPVYLSSLRYPDNILLLLPNASPLGD